MSYKQIERQVNNTNNSTVMHVHHQDLYVPLTKASTLHVHDSNGTLSSHDSGHTR